MISYQGPYSSSYRWAPGPRRMGQAPATVTSVTDVNNGQSKESGATVNVAMMIAVSLGVGFIAFILGQMSASKD